jgi:hypothetical protein
MALQIKDAVSAYMKLRAQKDALETQIESQVKEIKGKMDKLEAWLKVQMDAQGLTSVKSDAGTAFLTTTDYATVESWDATLQFIREHDAYDLLNKAVNKTAVRAYIEQNKAVPPGVNYGTRLEVSVRKPRAKVED